MSAHQERPSDTLKPWFPLGGAEFAQEKKATVSCYCGAVRIRFPTEADLGTFICNCNDCRKVTASMFASNFIINEADAEYLSGKDNLKKWDQTKTIESGEVMTNAFCNTCGTLMYRASTGFPGKLIPRIGTLDDYNLAETLFKPRVEQYTKDRVGWLSGGVGVEQHADGYYDPRKFK